MELLKERIRKEGKILPGNIVKVDGFLNHRIDVPLMEQIAQEFRRVFAGKDITLVLTAEASGIALATICAQAFGVPMVQRIQPEKGYVQGVILCPTRELCLQITEELQKLGKYIPGFSIVAVYGGQSMQPQINALRKNPQIVVATPGRLMDHMRRRNVAIDRTEMIVLDEADEMLDMGFYQDVRWILDRVPRTKQMSMFSATISREVMDIGWLYQLDPVELVVEPVAESKPRITQYCIKCSGRERIETLINLLKREEYRRSMVFCNTKYGTVSLVTHLEKAGIRAKCLNGDMEQAARNRIMGAYRNNEFDVLVATDVAARGIDVEQVDAAFNYEIPNENEYYLHRIGRTGRAGREGVSFVFYSENERPRLKTILKYSGNSYHPITVNADGSFTACGRERPKSRAAAVSSAPTTSTMTKWTAMCAR